MTDVTFTIRLQGADAGGSAAVQKVVDLVKQLGVAERGATGDAQKLGTAVRGASAQAQGFGRVASALKGIFAGISAALVIRSLGRLALDQLAVAEATGKMSQALGIGTESLSVLHSAAKFANVENETLELGLRNLAKASQELKKPNSESAAALKALGINATEFMQLPLDKQFLKIADASSKYAGSSDKLLAIGALVGPRVVAPLIPLLNKLGTEGYAKARAEAERFGLVVTEEGAKKAAEFGDAIGRLQGQVRGLAGAFATGLAPAVTNVFDSMIVGAEDGASAMQQLGKDSGSVFKALTGSALFLTTSLRNFFDFLTSNPLKTEATLQRMLERNTALSRQLEDLFPDPESQLAITRAKIVEEITGLERDIQNLTKKRGGKPEPWADLTGFTEVGLRAFRQALKRKIVSLQDDVNLADPGSAKQAQDAANARVNAIVEGIQAGLALQKEAFDQELQAADASYAEGLTSLQEFYRDRRNIIFAAAAAEVSALDQQADAIARRVVANPQEAIQRAADIAKVNDQVAQVVARRDREAAAENIRQRAAIEELGRARLEVENAVLIAQGKTAEAAQRALDQQLRDQRRILEKSGVTGEAQDAAIGILADLGRAKILLDDLSTSASRTFASLGSERQRIEALVATGVISAVEGEEQILLAEQQRLPIIRQIRQELEALALTIQDPATLEAIRAQIAELDLFELSAKRATAETLLWRQAMQDATGQAVMDSLTLMGDIIRGTADEIHNVGDAFRALANIAVNAIQQVIQKLIQARIEAALFRLIAGIGGAGANAGVQGFSVGPVGAATGGYLVGRSHRSGGIHLEAEGGEFIFPKSHVRGRLAFFQDLYRLLSAGLPTPRLISRGGRYEHGGLVAAGAGGGTAKADLSGQLQVALGPGLQGQWLNSPAFRSRILQLIAENPNAIRSGLDIHG